MSDIDKILKVLLKNVASNIAENVSGKIIKVDYDNIFHIMEKKY